FRADDFRKWLADDFFRSGAQHGGIGSVDKRVGEVSSALRQQQRCHVRNSSKLQSLGAEVIVGASAVDKLTKLGSDITDHLQEMVIDLAHLTTEAFHHAQSFLTEF